MIPRIRDSVKCEIANIITSSSKANNRHTLYSWKMLTSLSQRTSGGGYTDTILLDFAIDSDSCRVQAIPAN